MSTSILLTCSAFVVGFAGITFVVYGARPNDQTAFINETTIGSLLLFITYLLLNASGVL